MESAIGAIGLVGFAGAFLAIWWIAVWVLRPLDIAAKSQKLPMRFTLADFLCLFVLVQTSAAGLLFEGQFGWTIVCFGWAAFGSMWALGVHTLSRAGVVNPWHRALFLVLVVPFTVVSAILLAPAALTLAASLFSPMPPFRGLELLLAILAVPAAIAVLYGLGRLTRRMVRRRTPPVQNDPAPWVPADFDSEEE